MSQQHRLFYVVGQLGGGGLERQLWYLLSTMDREAYRPGVAVWDYDPNAVHVHKLQNLGVTLYPIPRRGGFLSRALRLRKLVQELQPELLHSYSFPTNFPAWWAMRGLGGVTIGSLRNEYWAERNSLGRIGGALCSRLPSWLIANNQCAVTAAQKHRSGTAPRNVAFVPNGLDLSIYPTTEMPEGDPFEMIGIGRLAPQKGWEDMLEVLALFREKTPTPWRFRLCGDGPLADKIQRRCIELSLEGNVQFMGYRDDIPSLLSSSHVLLLTSIFEGTPNVVLEAMAVGRAVVAMAAGDVPRLICDGEEGFVIPIADRETMVDRLLRLAADRAAVVRMGQSARSRAAAELSLEGLLARTLAVYRQAGWNG